MSVNIADREEIATAYTALQSGTPVLGNLSDSPGPCTYAQLHVSPWSKTVSAQFPEASQGFLSGTCFMHRYLTTVAVYPSVNSPGNGFHGTLP